MHTKRLQITLLHNFSGQIGDIKEQLKVLQRELDDQAVTLRDLKEVQEAHTELLEKQSGACETVRHMHDLLV